MKQLFVFLLFLFAGLPGLSAQNTVRGRVTDNTGQALAGVTIKEKGTVSGTSSGVDGTYSLRVSDGNAVVVFSYTGFATQEIALGGRPTLDVTLLSDETLLDQIVIVGSRRGSRVQTETPVPIDVINVGQVAPTTARYDVTSMLNYSAPSFNYNKQSGSDGADHIDLATLRGLGPDQTLVLVNGKRRHQTAFVAVFGTRGRGNAGTDLSAIPAQAIDRIEILRDGASAQYGSDAIAGVINIVLKKNVRSGSADFGFSGYLDSKYNPAYLAADAKDVYGDPLAGQYIYDNKLDGATYTAQANYGLPLGQKGGFLNLTLNYANAGKTFRQDLDGELPVNIYRRAHGDGSLQGYGALFNAEVPFKENDKLTLYVFGGFNRKESDAYAFTRNFSARPERFPTDDNGNPIPVDGITMSTPGGEFFYNPRIQTEIQDISAAAGLRGNFGEGWTWDLSNTTGYNDFHFFGHNTFNAGLGTSQTHFDDGGFSFLQNTTNLNFSRLYPEVLSGFNLAFGAEFRLEQYQLYAGEEASYRNYDPDKASGAQGFPGYQPSDEADASRNCVGAYADVELDVTERFLVGGAVRLENYSDFGFTANGKLSARYKITDNFNLRGSASTGFRAPSLQQINFSSTFTTVQGGNIAEVKIAPNDNPITRAAGIPELTEEKSISASLGFSWRPIREFTVTLDAYQVQVKDRVVLSGQFDAGDTTLNPALTNELTRLNVSLAQFFANAVNTTNRGLDLVLDYNRRLSDGHIRFLVAANFQKMTIDEINVPSALNDTEGHRKTFLSSREQKFILASAPPMKLASTIEYGFGNFTVGTRLNYFGEITLQGYGESGLGIDPEVPKDDGSGYVPDVYVYGAQFVPDVYASWRFVKNATLHLGVDNFINAHPDLGFAPGAPGWAYNTETGGPWDSVQMGGNGMRVFARLGVTF
ncbi:MAG: TonB-dependent receptor [Saprospiraceae bacterium]|nr:TonB-dependent receptor [Saprospiraceae bacterium]